MRSRCLRAFRPSVEQLESRALPSGLNPAAAAPAPVRAWMDRHNYFSRLAQHGCNVVFLGDSITERWLSAGRASWMRYFAPLGSYDFGINGDATQNLLWRVKHGELSGPAPKEVVIMIGTNNVASASAVAIVNGISSIAQTIRANRPGTKVLLLGILPRGGPDDTFLRANITAVNQRLARLDNGSSIRFVDPSGYFTDGAGVPRTDLMPDYLHPNAIGYEVLSQAISKTVRALLNPGQSQPASRPPTSVPVTQAAQQAPSPPPGIYEVNLAQGPAAPNTTAATGVNISNGALGGSNF